MSVLRLLGSEGNLATASNVGHAKLVRVFNNHSAVQLVTQKIAAGTTISTITLGIGETALLAKGSTDTFTAATTTLAVSVGFAN